MLPYYDLDKIKFSTDEPTFERAVGLYERGKVTRFQNGLMGYFAVVLGTEPYDVFVSDAHHDHGSCTCYLGREDTLCKHMVAVALYAIKNGKKLTDEDKKTVSTQISSGK